MNKDHILIIGAGNSPYQDIILAMEHLKSKAKNIVEGLNQSGRSSGKTFTVKMIEDLAVSKGKSMEEILQAIESLQAPCIPKLSERLEELKLTANQIPIAVDSFNRSIINRDDRPFYQKLADKGGKKRKQKYYNKQKW